MMLLSDIREAIGDRWPSAIDTGKLNRMIAAAVRYYSRFNPTEQTIDLTTVSDQQEYDLVTLGATGCIGIIAVLWYSSGTTYSTLRKWDEPYYSAITPYNMPSQRVINDINQSASVSAQAGYYRFESAERKLVIWSTPAVGGTTFTVRYYAEHAINAGGTEYTTIPDADLELIVACAIAELLDGKGNAAAFSPDYQEGLERVSFKNVTGMTYDQSATLRSRVSMKYGGGGMGFSFP